MTYQHNRIEMRTIGQKSKYNLKRADRNPEPTVPKVRAAGQIGYDEITSRTRVVLDYKKRQMKQGAGERLDERKMLD